MAHQATFTRDLILMLEKDYPKKNKHTPEPGYIYDYLRIFTKKITSSEKYWHCGSEMVEPPDHSIWDRDFNPETYFGPLQRQISVFKSRSFFYQLYRVVLDKIEDKTEKLKTGQNLTVITPLKIVRLACFLA